MTPNNQSILNAENTPRVINDFCDEGGHHRVVDFGDRTLSFAEHGDPDGRPLMFFHGWPSSRYQGVMLDRAAREQGIRLITPDRPGIGMTTFAPVRKLLDWPPLVESLADFLSWDTFSILGVSGGGPYVLACASQIPQRLLHAGIICGAPPVAALPDPRKIALPYRLLIRANRHSNLAMKVAAKAMQFSTKVGPHSWLMKAGQLMIPAADRLAIRGKDEKESLFRSYRHAFDNGAEPVRIDGEIYLQDWQLDLTKIEFPLRWWHGEKDANLGIETAKWTASQLPNCRTQWFPDEGHYSLPVCRADEILHQLMA